MRIFEICLTWITLLIMPELLVDFSILTSMTYLNSASIHTCRKNFTFFLLSPPLLVLLCQVMTKLCS
jgi:hypothetical protein